MPPNLILLVIDDLGWRDLTCYGSTFYDTPHLDQLAREGARFTDAYSSCPVCSPTRASLLSGKHPARLGLTNYIGNDAHGRSRQDRRVGRLLEAPYLPYLPLSERSLATALGSAGYQTWHVGKWHLGDEDFGPEAHGFARNIGGCHWGFPAHGYFSPWGIRTLPDAAPGTYLTDHLTDQAIACLRTRDRHRPFFLNFWHYAVHTPIQAPPALEEVYRRKAKALGLDRAQAIVDGEEMPVLPWSDGPMDRVRRRVIQSDPTYAAMIANLDANIGRLLDALRAEGVEQETAILFTSDNGGLATAEGSPTCNLPLAEGKGWFREGGTRVCQLLRWPGVVAPGLTVREPVSSCDVYPTFLEIAGLPLDPRQHRDGVSLLPLVRGGRWTERPLFWHFPHYGNQGGRPAAWVLADGWKLIHHYETDRDELFHLASDIAEAHDLAAEHPEERHRLRQLLSAWQRSVEAVEPSPNPAFEALRRRVPAVVGDPFV